MDILDQLGSKVKGAVKKIEELQVRIMELEEKNEQYENKMKEWMDAMDIVDETDETSAPETEDSQQSFGAQQEDKPSPFQQQY